MLRKQGFNEGWRDIPEKELPTNMYSNGEIDLIGKFSAILLNNYGLSNQFIEVVHGETGKNFLVDELHLFRVKML